MFRTVLPPLLKPVLFFLPEIYRDAGSSKVSLQLDDLFLGFTLIPPYHSVPVRTVSKKIPSYRHGHLEPVIIQWKIKKKLSSILKWYEAMVGIFFTPSFMSITKID